MKLGAMVAVSSFALSQVAVGQAVQWRVEDGGNGHWYEVVISPGGVYWEQARADAELKGATLACLETATERDYCFATFTPASNPDAWANQGPFKIFGPWLGAYQAVDGSEPSGGWMWVSGVQFDPTYPPACCNDACGGSSDEDRLHLYYSTVTQSMSWNDLPSHVTCGEQVKSALFEWSADCNNDGIVDYGQCRDGSLPDYNGNNIPDCCEQGADCTVGDYPVQWRVEDGGNGHWYRGFAAGTDWLTASARAEDLGGHLATCTTAGENAFARFVRDAECNFGGAWIGLRQAPGSNEPAGGWGWVTGEPFNWTNWSPLNPDNASGGACPTCISDFGELCCGGDQWSDWIGTWALPYIVEWSADCNNDGIVDYGQILLGQLADVDANGVLDVCESYEVPSEFATIQAAIDAVPAGHYGLVLVAAGTRHESFSLNGKNVRVQGAANNATILDGTGLTTSIARFTGGEPVTAGLANLVFRNGTAGSRIYPKATFTVGGAVYGINSSASITTCRFEQNRADYGGGVYMLYSSMNMSDCDFAGNIAENEGGGVLVYETSGSLAGCDFTQNACGVSGPGSGSGFKSVGARVAGETVLLSGCTFTGGIAGVDGSAVEHFENAANVRGKLRMVGCTVTGNASNLDAAGLRMTGAQASCVLTGGTTICSNTPRNVDGPFLIEGTATVCGCLADVTGDGQVNGGDLGIVLNSWGGADALGSGDVNHDGMIDGSDLSIVLSSWGACGG